MLRHKEEKKNRAWILSPVWLCVSSQLLKWINPNKTKIDAFKWIILSVFTSPLLCCLTIPELITMITKFSLLFFEQIFVFVDVDGGTVCDCAADGKILHCFPMLMIFILLSLYVPFTSNISSEVLFKFFFFNHLTNESCVGFQRKRVFLLSFFFGVYTRQAFLWQ